MRKGNKTEAEPTTRQGVRYRRMVEEGFCPHCGKESDREKGSCHACLKVRRRKARLRYRRLFGIPDNAPLSARGRRPEEK